MSKKLKIGALVTWLSFFRLFEKGALRRLSVVSIEIHFLSKRIHFWARVGSRQEGDSVKLAEIGQPCGMKPLILYTATAVIGFQP